MVICKYFLHGTCRFGENCKNEHAYNNNAQSVLHKKPEVDINVIVKAVHDDVENSDKSGQWPLSCYGPFQGKPCIPGIEDNSFEEIRLQMYEAQKNGTLEQYKQQLAHMIQQNKLKMKTLQHPSPEIRNLLQQLYNVTPNNQANVFRNTNTFSTTNPSPLSQSVFGNTQQSNSIFGNTKSSNFTFTLPENKTVIPAAGNIFSNNFNQNTNNTSIFGNNPTNTNSSIFAPPNQTAFNQNFSGSNIFQSNVPTTTNYGTSATPNVFSNTQGIFNSAVAPVQSQQTSMFSNAPLAAVNQPSSIFGNAQPQASVQTQQNSIFGNTAAPASMGSQQSSIFGNVQPQAPIQSQQSSIFGNVQPVATMQNQPSSIFSNVPASTFSSTQPSIFSNQPTSFASQPTQQAVSPMFAQTSSPQSAFPAAQQSSVFQPQANIFGGSAGTPAAAIKPRGKVDANVYSKLEDLNNNDLKCYEAASFEFGRIPEMAPPIELC